MRISSAATRPLPSAVLRSCWATMPARLSASMPRTWGCSSAGKELMMRSMVAGALLVCTVANTSTPKLASCSASFIVSLVRSSPMRMTLGSSRPAERMAVAKLEAWVPTSRCVTWDFADSCTNSTGSSMVRMCAGRVWLMWWIIAASVVDLPQPVGPVTSTRPLRRSASLRTTSGVVELLQRQHLAGDGAEDGRQPRRLVEVVGAEARLGAVAVGEVEVQLLGDLPLLLGAGDLEEQRLHLLLGEAAPRAGA